MITISEGTPRILCGPKALFITFDKVPTQEMRDILKSCDLYDYNDKNHTWELPITELAHLIDCLTYLDDIRLVFESDETNYTSEPQKLIVESKIPLFSHQKEAVLYGLSHQHWLLLDAPGLGKSLSMIHLAEELKAQRGLEHCLIICGINTLKTNWEKEINKHSNLDCVVIGKKVSKKGKVSYATIKERAEQLKNPIKEFFVIINIESLREEKIIDAINESSNNFDMMVFDEAHKAKGWSSKQGTNLLELHSNYMIAMTGTLLVNNPLDAYVPLAWIGIERKKNVTRFKKTYCTFEGSDVKGRITGFKNLDMLKDEIESCSLRRTKDLLNLPSKNIIDEVVEMNDSHRKLYDSVKDGIKEECDKIELKSSNTLSLITRLRQATSCPSSLTSQDIVSTKIERCLDLVEEITSNGDKVVIFSTFKEPVYQLQELLKDYNPLVGTGDMKDEEVSQNIDLFQEDDSHKVFLGTLQKMGTGVTLTRASYMIFIDLPWTSALYEQACDRIHRIGSEKPVFIYNLICSETIDELVAKLITRKEALSDFVIDNVADEKTLSILRQYIIDLE